LIKQEGDMDEMYPTTLSEKKIQHLAEEKILNPGSGFRRRPKKPNSFGVATAVAR